MKFFTLLVLLLIFLYIACAAPSARKATLEDVARDLSVVTRQNIDPALFTCGSDPPNSRVRKDLRDLSPKELATWRNVTRTLLTERPSGELPLNPPPSFWDLMVAVHIKFTEVAHGNANFLPWHRYFILLLENHIRKNYVADFVLPYWDWSSPIDAPDPALSAIWNPDMAGGGKPGPAAGDPVGGVPIPDGPFKGTSRFYTKPGLITRNFDAFVSGSMASLTDDRTFEQLIQDESLSFDDFSAAVENAHNQVHDVVGGDMGSLSNSPNDPVFYLNHINVDRVWWEREQLFGNEFIKVHQPNKTDDRTPELSLFDLNNADKLEDNCVTYKRFVPPSNLENVLVATPRSQTIDDLIRECSIMGMSVNRCMRGAIALYIAKQRAQS